MSFIRLGVWMVFRRSMYSSWGLGAFMTLDDLGTEGSRFMCSRTTLVANSSFMSGLALGSNASKDRTRRCSSGEVVVGSGSYLPIMIFRDNSSMFLAWKGGCSAMSSYTKHPMAHMSDLVS